MQPHPIQITWCIDTATTLGFEYVHPSEDLITFVPWSRVHSLTVGKLGNSPSLIIHTHAGDIQLQSRGQGDAASEVLTDLYLTLQPLFAGQIGARQYAR